MDNYPGGYKWEQDERTGGSEPANKVTAVVMFVMGLISAVAAAKWLSDPSASLSFGAQNVPAGPNTADLVMKLIWLGVSLGLMGLGIFIWRQADS